MRSIIQLSPSPISVSALLPQKEKITKLYFMLETTQKMGQILVFDLALVYFFFQV